MIYLIPILVILAALMDGLQHSNRKLIGSFFKSAFILGIGLTFIFSSDYQDFIYLLLCWWILFDPIYNKIRGEGMFYVGKTKWTDRLLRWMFRTNAPHASFITKLMALAGIIALIV